jgi:hypothetical protein
MDLACIQIPETGLAQLAIFAPTARVSQESAPVVRTRTKLANLIVKIVMRTTIAPGQDLKRHMRHVTLVFTVFPARFTPSRTTTHQEESVLKASTV